MSDTPVIRPAREDDLDAVSELAELAWRPIYAEFRRRLGDDLDSRLRPQVEGLKEAQVRQAFAQHPGCMIVTEIGGRIAAFATFFVVDRDKRIGEIGNNAVHPDFQGRGLARQQYERIFAELRQLGMDYVRVTTGLDDAHAPARKAYEAVGFDRNLPQLTYYREL
jgi:ribosomal protein S18 acetylase RimI-like enzyme